MVPVLQQRFITAFVLVCVAGGVGLLPLALGLKTTASLFSDVVDTHPYAEAIDLLRTRGIVNGYEDGTYRPGAPVNRAEFMQIVVRATGRAEAAQECVEGFHAEFGSDARFLSDVPPGAWFEPALCTAVSSGIVSGYDDGTFRPDRVIAVAEAAKILAGSFGLVSADASDPWYKRFVDALAEARALPADIGAFDQQVDRGLLAEMTYLLVEPNHAHATVTYDDVGLHGAAIAPDHDGILAAVNARRAAAGLSELSRHPLLDQAALSHSENMLRHDFYAHEDPEGRRSGERIQETGYFDDASSYAYGETIMLGTKTLDATIDAFMHSPLHKSIVLSPEYDEMGGGRAGDYWTFVFARARR